ncbi:MAG TPA: helix-turn-helix transcriptional regulator [Solirubrobacteraceae bacterium]|jgi:transcriptional regulator with XRE-family HTH domain|nr:helix-turn-helix transcriptional regulator [Solirubrobacteraceae bacterium]
MPASVSEEYRREIGLAIKDARKKRGMSQDALGLAVGNSKNAVSAWERGESAPTAENLRNLCSVLGVAPQRLLVMNGATTAGEGPDPAAVRMLADQLADLRREAQEIIPDLMGVLADAERTARRMADR